MDVTRLLIALAVGLAILIFFLMKTKIHAALALVISAAVVGIIGGVDLATIPGLITSGFGNTLAGIGLVIAFGVMMGQVMEESNAAKVMAHTFIKALKGKHEDVALSITGFLVSIPIFADSAFIILSPLVKSISQAKKKSLTGLGLAMGMSLCITHASVPPTPGPLAVVAQFGNTVDLGTFMLFAIAMGIPVMVVAIILGRYFGKKWYKIVDDNGEIVSVSPEEAKTYAELSSQPTITKLDPNEHYPSAVLAFAPIFVPVILILLSTVTSMVHTGDPTSVTKVINFVGSPVIAISIALLVAIYGLAGNKSKTEVADCLERGLRSCGTIIIITGAGGAFGNIIKSSGIGDVIAQGLTDMNLPVIVLPFLMAGILKLVLGSGTVSMTTTATICAPILMQIPGANMMFCAYAACMGSQMFSLHNDSFFWVITRSLKLEKIDEQVFGWCGIQFICSWAAFALLCILNVIF